MFASVIFPDKGDRMEACLIVAGLGLVLASILHGLSHEMYRKDKIKQAAADAGNNASNRLKQAHARNP